jgi:hypothetical protein
MARVVEVISVKSEPKYFCKEDWTAKSPDGLIGQINGLSRSGSQLI